MTSVTSVTSATSGTSTTPRPATLPRQVAAPRRLRRTPFAVLVVFTLAAGLVAQLLLNTSLAQGAFTLQDLQQHSGSLANEKQALAQHLARLQSPQQLEERARALGLVPSGSPAFLDLGGAAPQDAAVPAQPPPAAAAARVVSPPSSTDQATSPVALTPLGSPR